MDNRTSIFSFNTKYVTRYYTVCLLINVAYGIMISIYEGSQNYGSFVEAIIVIVERLATFIPVSILLTLCCEGVVNMILSYLKRLHEKEMREQMEEILRQAQEAQEILRRAQEAEDWNKRRLAAKKAGEDFDEDMPSIIIDEQSSETKKP